MAHVSLSCGHSERRVCKAPGISRNTVRYEPQPRPDEAVLTGAVVRLAGQYGRYGYRRIHALLRDELLNGELFYTLREAQVIIERWRVCYNTLRPNSSLGYRPPAPETLKPIEELQLAQIAA